MNPALKWIADRAHIASALALLAAALAAFGANQRANQHLEQLDTCIESHQQTIANVVQLKKRADEEISKQVRQCESFAVFNAGVVNDLCGWIHEHHPTDPCPCCEYDVVFDVRR